jgi:hypothetical protein
LEKYVPKHREVKSDRGSDGQGIAKWWVKGLGGGGRESGGRAGWEFGELKC